MIINNSSVSFKHINVIQKYMLQKRFTLTISYDRNKFLKMKSGTIDLYIQNLQYRRWWSSQLSV